MDANHNSAYPYVVGPTFYGNKTAVKVTSITETTTQYTLSTADYNLSSLNIKIYPNPAQDFIAIQSDVIEEDLNVTLIDELGKVIQTNKILQGSTLAIIETNSLYNGVYFVKVASPKDNKTFKIIVHK